MLQINLNDAMIPTTKLNEVNMNRYKLDIADVQELADRQKLAQQQG